MKLGKAKYSGEKKEVFKIKDGDNAYLILPPMGKLADAGVYSRYFKVVWGFKDSNGRLQPFISPRRQNFKTKMIEVDCAATNMIFKMKDDLKAATDQAKDLAKEQKTIPSELKQQIETLKELVGQKGRFNIDSKHHMNALSKDGKIGLLKLAGRGMQALRVVFKSLESQGIDPTGVEGGRFMVINREGTGLDTVYAVREMKEQVQTAEYGLVEKAVPHTLSEALISRLSAEAYELDEIYPAPTESEVAEIVAAHLRSEVEGAAAVDRILASNGKLNQTPSEEIITSEVTETLVVSQEEVSDEIVTAAGKIIEETPVLEETPAAVETTVSAPINTAAQNDKDFLAELGIKL